ncbi:hypothetical protein BT69DRAFT_1224111 [Atractiella rhizophila]|nr:hypothetical protein BT69DRAFT_1224111 [Atractiella rhizophila]
MELLHHANFKFKRRAITSREVDIPKDFLKKPIPPPTVEYVDWEKEGLPEYVDCYAVVLDGVLMPAECEKLLELAVQSSTTTENEGWGVAMLNAGIGREVLALDYRNCDRIIWDTQVIADRILERCLLAPGIKKDLEVLEDKPWVMSMRAVERGESWKLSRPNDRLRFLKYGSGQFFKAHCDGRYVAPDFESSYYTLHLYLNDSKEYGGTLEGGATTFHAKKDLDVHPKAGRVLIFQHAKLLHSGAEVNEGIKFTVRTDLMYRMVEED